MAKEFLSQRGVKYVEKDVSIDRAAAQELVRRSGQMGVPVITANGDVIVGFDRARLALMATRVAAGAGARRPGLGLKVADAAKYAAKAGISWPSEGAYVGGVTPGSPGDRAGVRTGDVIVELNGHPVRSTADLEKAASSISPGKATEMVAVREGRPLRLQITF